MLIESKYTAPLPASVAQALAPKPNARPSAIGVSRPMRRCRSSASAPEKKGVAEKSTTGKVISRLAQRMTCSASGPTSSTYAGNAYIMTCIAPNAATNTRHSAARRSRRSSSSWRRGA